MDARMLGVRNLTFGMFVELGRAPTAEEVAQAAGLSSAEVDAAWADLHREHELVLDPITNGIRMAIPFSAVPTAYRVQAAGRWWYGNCAWDAIGICAALHVDGRIESTCPDCGESISIEVRDQHVDDESLLFHSLVPAARWFEDVVFT